MKVVVIKYNAGNIQSVLNAMERLGCPAELSDDPLKIQQADRVIFPGVGEASSAMQYLKGKNLVEVIRNLRQPVLGICLGMQLLGIHSAENDAFCLGVVPALIKKISNDMSSREKIKVPHIGWNTVQHDGHALFKNISTEDYFYFVHSYAVELTDCTIARTHYGQLFSSAVQWRNFYGVQFHPEKSSTVGEQLLRNFLQIKTFNSL